MKNSHFRTFTGLVLAISIGSGKGKCWLVLVCLDRENIHMRYVQYMNIDVTD